jgi:hypothetical protein
MKVIERISRAVDQDNATDAENSKVLKLASLNLQEQVSAYFYNFACGRKY